MRMRFCQIVLFPSCFLQDNRYRTIHNEQRQNDRRHRDRGRISRSRYQIYGYAGNRNAPSADLPAI